jgi:hypothetical protein
MWSPMRWRFPRFLLLALGGVVPFLSFILEARFAREVKAFLAEHDTDPTAPGSPTLASPTTTSEGRP